jgi:hypothetical protein
VLFTGNSRKLDPNGKILWLDIYNDLETGNDYCDGHYSDDAAKAVGIDDLGNVYVTGYNCSIGDYRLGQSFSYNFLTIKYSENQAPQASCQNVTVSPDPGFCAASASVDNGSFDPDGDTLTLDQTPPGPYNDGTTQVTLAATDDKGASDSCTAQVTVVTPPPTISCPADVTINASPLQCSAAATNVSLGKPTTSGVCDLASVTNDVPEHFQVGTTAVTWTVTDGGGATATCQQQVTVLNPEPVVTLTGPLTGSLYRVNTPVNFTATFTDVGGGTPWFTITRWAAQMMPFQLLKSPEDRS